MDLELLKKILKYTLNNEINSDIEQGVIAYPNALTLIGFKRLNNIQFCIENVLKNNIEGNFIETGVYKGDLQFLWLN